MVSYIPSLFLQSYIILNLSSGLKTEKQCHQKGHNGSIGKPLVKFYFASQSTGLQVKILHLKQDYRQKYGTYITSITMRSGYNNKVTDIYPKLANNSICKYEAWETS